MRLQTKEAEMECSTCGYNLEDSELVEPFLDKFTEEPICDECYRQNYEFRCGYCEDYHEDIEGAENFKFVLTREDASESSISHGVYSVLKFPFYYGDILSGFDGFFEGSIKLEKALDVVELKKVDCGINSCEAESGRICSGCFDFLMQPLNRVRKSQEIYINMDSKRKMNRSINLKGILNAITPKK